MLALCAIGAVMGWRTFDRLETTGGGGDARWAASTRRDASAARATLVRRSPIWLLVAKELRLQQITFVVAAMFVGFYLFIVLRRAPGADRSEAVVVITAINIVVTSLIVGSLASAEERHLGTLDWQLLLPMSAARQWAVKVISAVTLMLLLTALLPMALVWLLPPGPREPSHWTMHVPPLSIVLGLVCLTTSLYVSSLVSSGLRALVTAVPALFAAITFTRLIGTPSQPPWRMVAGMSSNDRLAVLLVVLSGLLAVVAWFALMNHRTADRGWRRLAIQVGCIAAGLAVTEAAAQALGLL